MEDCCPVSEVVGLDVVLEPVADDAVLGCVASSTCDCGGGDEEDEVDFLALSSSSFCLLAMTI